MKSTKTMLTFAALLLAVLGVLAVPAYSWNAYPEPAYWEVWDYSGTLTYGQQSPYVGAIGQCDASVSYASCGEWTWISDTCLYSVDVNMQTGVISNGGRNDAVSSGGYSYIGFTTISALEWQTYCGDSTEYGNSEFYGC
jgi:hypothetical protein